MNKELLLQGLQLMVFGMGMVYVFLIIMIFCMNLLKRVLAPIVARQEAAAAAEKAAAAKAAAPAASGNDANLVAAAVAAVAASRR